MTTATLSEGKNRALSFKRIMWSAGFRLGVLVPYFYYIALKSLRA